MSDLQVRSQIVRYLAGDISLDALEEWAVVNGQDFAPGSLGAALDHALIVRNDLGEGGIERELRQLIRTVTIAYGPAAPTTADQNTTRFVEVDGRTHGNDTVVIHRALAGRSPAGGSE